MEFVWKGLVTNDTLHPLRAYSRTGDRRSTRRDRSRPFRSRRLVPPAAEGRWSLVQTTKLTKASSTDWAAAMAQQLLTRHGVVTRETVAAEAVSGGFTAVYDVLKAMEDTGRVRRGYFVAGLGAAQFAMPAALDLLRAMRDAPEEVRTGDPRCHQSGKSLRRHREVAGTGRNRFIGRDSRGRARTHAQRRSTG